MRVPVAYRGAVQSASVREGIFEGRSYIVAPVVMMVGDAVIRSMGSRGPEMVPLEELERAPGGWNYRPVVMNHPTDESGGPALACTPEIVEKFRFGYIFGADVRNGKLTAEMWLDPERAAIVGAEAVRFIERVQAGEIADVSVGALVAVEQVSGTSPSGDRYEYVWHDFVPDHLAALPEGTPGACSVGLGCGTPRAASAAKNPEVGTMTMIQRFFALFAKGDKGMSDSTTRGSLHSALYEAEAGFDSVYDVFPDSSTVIYTVYLGGEYHWKRRPYTMNSDGTATLGDAEEVMPKTTFEAVSAAGIMDTPAPVEPVVAASEPEVEVVPVAACGCGGQVATEAPAQKGEVPMEVTQKVKDLAGALIACNGSPYKEEDRPHLEALSESRLAEFAAQFAPKSEPAPAPVTASGERSEEDWLKDAPASVRALVSRAKMEEKARAAKLVQTLKGAQSHYSEEQLAAMDIEKLDELASVLSTAAEAQPVDFSGRVISAPANASALADHNATFAAALKSRAAVAN